MPLRACSRSKRNLYWSTLKWRRTRTRTRRRRQRSERDRKHCWLTACHFVHVVEAKEICTGYYFYSSSSSSSVPTASHGYEWMTSIVLGSFSSPLLPSMSVQLIRCPPLHCQSIVVWVCLRLFFLRILHVVHCVEFGQLSFIFYYYVLQTIQYWKMHLYDHLLRRFNVLLHFIIKALSCLIWMNTKTLKTVIMSKLQRRGNAPVPPPDSYGITWPAVHATTNLLDFLAHKRRNNQR